VRAADSAAKPEYLDEGDGGQVCAGGEFIASAGLNLIAKADWEGKGSCGLELFSTKNRQQTKRRIANAQAYNS